MALPLFIDPNASISAHDNTVLASALASISLAWIADFE